MEVRVHIPKSLLGVANRRCLVTYYGGAFLGNSACLNEKNDCKIAVQNNIVVVSVNEGNAPETKIPEMNLNGYAGFKWLLKNIKL